MKASAGRSGSRARGFAENAPHDGRCRTLPIPKNLAGRLGRRCSSSVPARPGYGLAPRIQGLGTAECRASKAAAERRSRSPRARWRPSCVSGRPSRRRSSPSAGPEGQPLSLADFKGRTILVNLWATWCVPCREEMPALDKLQAELGGADFEVVAINVDTRNPDKPKAWLQENGIGNLAYHADPSGKLLQVLQTIRPCGRPADHLLIDGNGCEIALLKGPAEWASPMRSPSCRPPWDASLTDPLIEPALPGGAVSPPEMRWRQRRNAVPRQSR